MNDRFKFRFFNKLSNEYENTYDLQSCEVLDYVVPEQCTGLKDKNGKLIYEGDIVKKEFKNKPFSSKAKTKEKLIKIKWNDAEACFSFDFLNEKDEHDDFQCWESGWGHKYSDDEVIGNIHENADLLEVKMINIQDIIPFMKDGWVAMDEDGKWCFFNYLPTIYKGKFGNMLDRVELYRGFDIAPADDWTKSLIQIKGVKTR